MMTTSSLPLFNLVPAQAQSTVSFGTTEPAGGSDRCLGSNATLTFHAQGTPYSSDPQVVDITNGTFKVTASDEQKSYSGNIFNGTFDNNTGEGEEFLLDGLVTHVSYTTSCVFERLPFLISAPCSTSNPVSISTFGVIRIPRNFGFFDGVVECSQGGDTTTQSSLGGNPQDGDGDGILDANDNCPNLSHTRCYKEGHTAAVVHNSNS